MENSSHTPANQAGRLGLIGVFSLCISLQQGFITTELTDHLTEHHPIDGCCIHSKKQQQKNQPHFSNPVYRRKGKKMASQMAQREFMFTATSSLDMSQTVNHSNLAELL